MMSEQTIEAPPARPEPVCECGCGRAVSPGRRFVAGHNGRMNSRKPPAPGRKTARTKAKGPDYSEAVLGLLQIPAAALAVAGTHSPVLAADSVAISAHSPGIAAAVNQLAQQRPEVAAALDRVLQVGPYSALIAACLPMVLQVLTNHGVVPAGLLGTQTPQSLLGLPVED